MHREHPAFRPAAPVAAAATPATPNYASVTVTLAVALAVPALACAAPTGGQVTSGVATVLRDGGTTVVNQTTHKAVIDWQNFSVGADETVRFDQPGRSSVVLNRVIGGERSVIDGAVNANGQVFIVNSAGVLFGRNSSVNVGGLVASTRDIANTDFEAGRYVFAGSGDGAVVNRGSLAAPDGYVALIGNRVSNEGSISAMRGTAALAAGDKVTLRFGGNALLGITVDAGTFNALVENHDAIVADGGTVLLTAKAADALQGALVNNDGLVQAHTIGDLTGRIELLAHGGSTRVDGTLDAGAPGAGNGGFIETSGDRVHVADSARIRTRAARGRNGKWLVDPVDFTIAPSGGDVTGAFLSNYLDTEGDYEVQSAKGSTPDLGDIHVNDAISWGKAGSTSTLTLTAEHDIHINDAITIKGKEGRLVLNAGGDYDIRTKASYSGTVLDAAGKPVPKTDTSGGKYGSITFTHDGNADGLVINGTTYTLIHSMDQWAGLNPKWDITADPETLLYTRDSVEGHFAIARDLDAGGTVYASAPVRLFGGTLAGLGHTIDHFTMRDTFGSIGLIGATIGTFGEAEMPKSVEIRDLGMTNVDFTNVNAGFFRVGSILGEGTGTIRNVYATGDIHGGAGGIVGQLYGTVTSSYSSVNVDGGGSLADQVIPDINGVGGIFNSHATGNVTGMLAPGDHIGKGFSGGGLAGMVGGELVNSYATGNVTVLHPGMSDPNAAAGYSQFDTIGGLAGNFGGTRLENSFATGEVSGGRYVGGLVGRVSAPRTGPPLVIRNVFATGNVTTGWNHNGRSPDVFAGGLFGAVAYGSGGGRADISDVYATGNVTAATGGGSVGGLIGSFGSFTNYDGTAATSSLTNAYATGNVTVAVIPGEFSTGAGGLLGWTSNANISNVHADGNVSGNRTVGGLIGGASNATISDAYAKGAARGQDPAGAAGGFIGKSNNSSTSNVYYNADANERGNTNDPYGTGTQDIRGLKGTQLADAQYYANRTIDQVLAARDAAAAAEAARVAEEARAAEEAAAAAHAAEAARVAEAAAEAARVAEAARAAQAAAEAARIAEATRAAQAAEAARVAEAARAAQAAAEAARIAEAARAAAAAAEAARLAEAARAADAFRQAATQAGSRAVLQTAATTAPAPARPATSPAPSLDRNIAIADASRFSANVRRIEVDGQVFELDEKGDDPRTVR